MRTDEIRILKQLTEDFYTTNAGTFSDTRRTSWPGWQRALAGMSPKTKLSILDIASGNGRFEAHVAALFPSIDVNFTCIDSCEALTAETRGTRLLKRDIVSDLLDWQPDETRFFEGSYDLAVAFGFFHHVPSVPLRVKLMKAMAQALAPDGRAVASLWCFAEDDVMRTRAAETTRRGMVRFPVQLETGDYLLGWQGSEETYRYCHSFDSAQVDSLVRESGVSVHDRYRSDGRTGELNEYLVFS